MAPKYKLTYFDVKGLAEPIRFLFHYAKVDFEDVRLTKDTWPNVKPQMEWGVLPVLEEDGKQLAQSVTIFRYLAKKFGLGAPDEYQTAKCDEYMDAMTDVRLEVIKMFHADETKKEEIKKKLQDETFPKVWKKFNDILKQNGTGFLVGKTLTYADIFIGYFVEYLSGAIGFLDKMEEYPELVAHYKKIHALPGIQDWIKKRPVTEF